MSISLSNMRVLGLGHCPIDELYRAEWTRSGSRRERIAGLSTPIWRGGGGAICNTLCLLAKLGHDCHMVGVCGQDSDAELIASSLQALGVTPHLVRLSGKRTPRFQMIWNAAGQRQTVLDWDDAPPNVSAEHWRATPAARMRFDVLLTEMSSPDVLHVATSATRLVFNAQSHRVSSTTRPRVRALVARTDLTVACEEFTRAFHRLPKEQPIAATALDLPSRLLVVTLGANGLLARRGPDEYLMQPIPSAVAAIDPTGAGDAFLGTLLHRLGPALSPNQSEWATACRTAQRVAGLCCTRLGARAYLDDWPRVLAALAE